MTGPISILSVAAATWPSSIHTSRHQKASATPIHACPGALCCPGEPHRLIDIGVGHMVDHTDHRSPREVGGHGREGLGRVGCAFAEVVLD